MGWVKLDDQFSRHPKVLQAGPLSGWLHICALNYSAQYLTDGFIPKAAVNGLADFSALEEDLGQTASGLVPMDFVSRLLKSGMWSEVDGGYQIHDYLDYNPSRDDIQKKRQADADRKKIPDGHASDSARSRNGVTADSIPPVPVPLPVPLRGEDVPPAATQRPPGARAALPNPKPEHPPIDDEYVEALVSEFATRLGGPAVVREEIEAALNHTAVKRCLDQRKYLRTWLTRDARRTPTRSSQTPLRAVSPRPVVPPDSPFLQFREVG